MPAVHLRERLRRAGSWFARLRLAVPFVLGPFGQSEIVPLEHMPSPETVVREFWRLMASNDFASVAVVLADDLVVEWPQSNERIRGSERFVRLNREYPAHGPWRFTLHRLVAGEREVVTQVGVTDGVQSAEPVSFFTVRDGKIAHMVEYWPEPFQPAENRRHLTEPIT